jgi:hypothetical protein
MRGGCVALLWGGATLLGAFAATDVQGQEFRATISGRITDASGAPVDGARVVATRVETNVSAAALANERGYYTLPFLAAGRYRVRATADAPFRATIREGVVLATAERVSIDLTLHVGAEETLEVAARLSAAESGRSVLSQTMDARRVAELPLNGRQVYMLMQLTSGTLNNQIFSGGGQPGTRAWDINGDYSIHGSRANNNEFLIDGAPHAATAVWQFSPVVDAVEEFKVQSAAVDASYGRTGGGVVNLTLKSGTNSLRGSAFWFHRGDSLDANTTQNNRAGIEKQGHEFDNYGFVVGGPIRRDRTFFLAAFDGFRDRVPFPRTVTVPTERQRRGDFSETYDSQGRPIVIYDPLTTRPDPSNPGRLIRDAFPGNVIPPERLSPVALNLMAHIPLPNVPGDPMTGALNHLASPNVGRIEYDSYIVRLDHQFGPRQRLALTSSGNWGAEYRSENGFPGPARRGNWPRGRDHYLNSLDHVWMAGERSVLNLRASFDRFVGYNSYDYARLDEDLGIQTPFQVVAQYPLINIDGYEGLFPNTARRTVNHIYSAQAVLSSSRGAHSLRLGGEFRIYTIERVSPGDGQGRFQFGRTFTQRDPLAGDGSGNAFASFLLGYPSGGSVEVASPSERRYDYGGLFVQDDWRPSPRLTLNLGLRWDYQAPVTERLDRLAVGFDTTSPSPLQVPGLDLRGGLVFGAPGRRSPYRPDHGNFQPRLGVAYKLKHSLTLRAHFGRSYLPMTGAGQEGFLQTGFSIRTPFVPSVRTGVPHNTLERPFPEGILQPAGASLGLLTQVGLGVSFINPDFKIPYADQWSVGFTADLPWHVTLDVAYVGSRTRRLQVSRGLNEIPLAERLKGIEKPAYLLEQVPNPFAGRLPGTPLNGRTVQRQQLLRPFPQFLSVTMERENSGSASYDALETTARIQRSGLVVSLAYTWMRAYESLGYLNPYANQLWRTRASFERPHRLALSAVWELPFARGRRGFTGLLLDGWQWNAIGEIQSGTPTGMPGGRLLADTARLPNGQQSIDQWFDNSTARNPRPDGTYAWEAERPFEFATRGPRMDDVRDPWKPQWTFALVKNMRLKERYNVQLRLEAFNAFNTPIYAGPDLDLGSPRFGRMTPDQINFPRHVQLGVRVTF